MLLSNILRYITIKTAVNLIEQYLDKTIIQHPKSMGKSKTIIFKDKRFFLYKVTVKKIKIISSLFHKNSKHSFNIIGKAFKNAINTIGW